MTEHDRWLHIQASLASIAADVAVIKSEMGTVKNAVDDHETRIRELEKTAGNNTLVRRAAVFVAALIIGSVASVSASLLLKLMGK